MSAIATRPLLTFKNMLVIFSALILGMGQGGEGSRASSNQASSFSVDNFNRQVNTVTGIRVAAGTLVDLPHDHLPNVYREPGMAGAGALQALWMPLV